MLLLLGIRLVIPTTNNTRAGDLDSISIFWAFRQTFHQLQIFTCRQDRWSFNTTYKDQLSGILWLF